MSDPCDMYKTVYPIWRYQTTKGEYVVYSNGTCKGFPKDGVVKINALNTEVERRIKQAIKYQALVIPISFRLHKIIQRLIAWVFHTQPKIFSEVQSENTP